MLVYMHFFLAFVIETNGEEQSDNLNFLHVLARVCVFSGGV